MSGHETTGEGPDGQPSDPWRAGRAPFMRPGKTESHSDAIDRSMAQFQALELDPNDVPLDSEHAPEAFTRFLRIELAPALRQLGFKGSGANFRLDRGDFRGGLQFQKSQHNTRALVKFTINLSAAHQPTKQGYWGDRIGFLLPERTDLWWRLPAGADTDDLLIDVLDAIRDYGLVALEVVLADPEFPPDPDRRWSRQFGVDPVNQTRTLSRNIVPTVFDLEWTISSLSDPDFGRRALSLSYLVDYAPDDPRTVPALVACLEGEPRTHTREIASRQLAFVPSDPGVVIPALQATASEDENLRVRLSARYALALIEWRMNTQSTTK
jgi:hypothetical protein